MMNEVTHLQSIHGGWEHMLNQDQWSMVKALAKIGYKIRKIARELDIDRNTVRKILKQEKYEPYNRKANKPSVLEPFITSNHGFTQWGDIFGDAIIATAILDRLLHHNMVINIKGEFSIAIDSFDDVARLIVNLLPESTL